MVAIYYGSKQYPNFHTSEKLCTNTTLVRIGILQLTISDLLLLSDLLLSSILNYFHSL